MGESDKPLARYSTSEMAKDTLELLNHLGWTSERQVHVIGAMLEPTRIASLSLISTAARLVNTVGFVENLRNRINLFIPKAIDAQLDEIKTRLFSESWLAEPDADGNFPTNGDRFAAQEVKKRLDTEGFTRKGFICQAIAAGWHHKSAKQLEQLGANLGRERIQVVHGTVDNMITVPHAETLVKELGGEDLGVKRVIFQGRGHVLLMEERAAFAKLITDMIERTEAT
ncbi:MAG: hypothetical protein Q9187_008620 [Circinaria calcarea]